MDVTLRRIFDVAVTNLATNLRRLGDVADSSCAHLAVLQCYILVVDSEDANFEVFEDILVSFS